MSTLVPSAPTQEPCPTTTYTFVPPTATPTHPPTLPVTHPITHPTTHPFTGVAQRASIHSVPPTPTTPPTTSPTHTPTNTHTTPPTTLPTAPPLPFPTHPLSTLPTTGVAPRASHHHHTTTPAPPPPLPTTPPTATPTTPTTTVPTTGVALRASHHHTAPTATTAICDLFLTPYHTAANTSHWHDGLACIAANHVHQPPDFRSTWLRYLKNTNEKKFQTLKADVLRAIVVASRDFDPSVTLPAGAADPAPFWWLLFHLEMLILAPSAKDERDGDSIALSISERIERLRNGDIAPLFRDAMAVSSWKAPSPRPDRPGNRAAQVAADSDSYRVAAARNANTAGIATIGATNIASVQKLYPPKVDDLGHPDLPPTPFQRHQLPGDICANIRRNAKNKGAGVNADSLDVYMDLVKLNIAEKRFAMTLLPFNYAVGVEGGMDFIIKSMQLSIEKFIQLPQQRQLDSDQPSVPTRAAVFIDLTNMFNSVSREELLDVIRVHYPELIPLARMLYSAPGTVHHRWEDGTWRTIDMIEGVNQGCPLSALFAAFVLDRVLRPLDLMLKERAAARLSAGDLGDDGYGSVTHLFGYVDDVSSDVPLVDLKFFHQSFGRLANRPNLHFNRIKSRILTSCDGESAIPRLAAVDAELAAEVQSVIAQYSVKATSDPAVFEPVELVSGFRLLGSPVGSQDFARDFFAEKIAATTKNADALAAGFADLQTRLRIFKQCTIQQLPHLLGAEVMHFLPLDFDGADWRCW
ncbi:hypothetical protein ACHAXR_009934, partial [Thalassiosira sp. AJA248-18]